MLCENRDLTILKITKPSMLVLAVLGSGVVVAAAGDFDPSYNGLGFTRDFIPDSSGASDLALDSMGRIVNAGYYFSQSEQSEHLLVRRHLADGALDVTFGGTGVVFPRSPPGLAESSNNSIAIDNQDRIIMVTATETGHLVHRLNVDGSADLSLSGTGSVDIAIGRSIAITGVAIQPDNQIVAVGGAINPASGRREFVIYRLQEDGDLDPSFGGTGIVYTQMTPGGGLDAATGVVLQPNGMLVVSGRARSLSAGSHYNCALARYLPTGVLDPDFGYGGKVIFGVLDDNLCRKLALQEDGKIVTGGSVCVDLGSGTSYCYPFAARLDPRGNFDVSFGGTGRVYIDIGGWGASTISVALQSDNKILLGGTHLLNPDFSLANALLVRYEPNGSLDWHFAVNGISETNYGYAVNIGGSVRVQPDGQIVVSGYTSRDPIASGSAVTARYMGRDSDGLHQGGTAFLIRGELRSRRTREQ